MRSTGPLPLAGGATAVIALVVVGTSDGWRTALAIAAVGAAVLATRVRFAPVACLALLAAMAALAVAGDGPGRSERPAHKRPHVTGR